MSLPLGRGRLLLFYPPGRGVSALSGVQLVVFEEGYEWRS
jgi:hypothetical protein